MAEFFNKTIFVIIFKYYSFISFLIISIEFHASEERTGVLQMPASTKEIGSSQRELKIKPLEF